MDTLHVAVSRWRSLTQRLHGGDLASGVIFELLMSLYRQPSRKYHGLTHIMRCLDGLDRFFPESQPRPPWLPVTELALWFHDVVYDAGDLTNEIRSAKVLVGACAAMGISSWLAEAASDAVLATTHIYQMERSPGTAWVLDMDLMSLAAEPEIFDKNSKDIREEFKDVPDGLFYPGRKKFLAGMLARPTIYLTPECQTAFEAGARANLQRSLTALG